MRHCVYSYGFAIQQRGTSIWSLRKEKERALTVQVMNDSKKIVQARGKCNRPARKIDLCLVI